MRLFFKTATIIVALIISGGCSPLNLTPHEKMYVHSERDIQNAQMRKFGKAALTPSLERQLWMYTPEELAAQAVKDRNYRLAAFTSGPDGWRQKPDIFGIKCTEPVEVEVINLGCIPPHGVFFKLVKRYNDAVFKSPTYPYKNVCVSDKEMDDAIKNNFQNPSKETKEGEKEFNRYVEGTIKESQRFNN